MNEARTTLVPVPNAFETSSVPVVNIYPEEFRVNNSFGASYAASLIN